MVDVVEYDVLVVKAHYLECCGECRMCWQCASGEWSAMCWQILDVLIVRLQEG